MISCEEPGMDYPLCHQMKDNFFRAFKLNLQINDRWVIKIKYAGYDGAIIIFNILHFDIFYFVYEEKWVAFQSDKRFQLLWCRLSRWEKGPNKHVVKIIAAYMY